MYEYTIGHFTSQCSIVISLLHVHVQYLCEKKRPMSGAPYTGPRLGGGEGGWADIQGIRLIFHSESSLTRVRYMKRSHY